MENPLLKDFLNLIQGIKDDSEQLQDADHSSLTSFVEVEELCDSIYASAAKMEEMLTKIFPPVPPKSPHLVRIEELLLQIDDANVIQTRIILNQMAHEILKSFSPQPEDNEA